MGWGLGQPSGKESLSHAVGDTLHPELSRKYGGLLELRAQPAHTGAHREATVSHTLQAGTSGRSAPCRQGDTVAAASEQLHRKGGLGEGP